MVIISEREIDRGGSEREKKIRRECERARERWKERKRERKGKRTVEILSEREKASIRSHTNTCKHALTDAYIQARIRIPDTHTHTYMRRHAQLWTVYRGSNRWIFKHVEAIENNI